MKVLAISFERNAFTEGDPARERFALYGKEFDELHIVVYADKSLGLKQVQIADNVWLYPTNSAHKLFYVPDAARIARPLMRRGIEVVSGQDLAETGIAAWWIARRNGARLQLQDHADVFDPWFSRESFGNRMRALCAYLLLPQAGVVRTVLPRVRARILKRFPWMARRVHALPVWTDTDALTSREPAFSLKERYPQFSRIALMASRLVPQKNIAFALRAFARADAPGLGLVIVGEGRESDKLAALTKELGVEDKVVFLPWQSDLAPYYKTADVFLLTSRYESYCRTLVEAASVGLPFVSTDVGVASLLAEGGMGTVRAQDDLDGFADALRRPMERTSGSLAAIEALTGKDVHSYVSRYRTTFETPEPRLLILTQVLDTHDPALGFFHSWIEAFARMSHPPVVICLYKGTYDLPGATVLSLGKEDGTNRLVRLVRLVRYAWSARHEYDAVFVHMTPIYVVLLGLFWRVCGKPVTLWYTHGSVDLKLRVAAFLASRVYTASTQSMRIRTRTRMVVGHGIDLARFIPSAGQKPEPPVVLSVSRIARVKRLDLLVDALALLRTRGAKVRAVLAGAPITDEDRAYEESLRAQVRAHKLEDLVSFAGPVTHEEVPALLRNARVFVNLSATESMDKAVIEALACEVPVVTANSAFREFLPEGMVEATPEAVADGIIMALARPGEGLRERALEHSLDRLIGRILGDIRSLCAR